jgi:hypothetical protein
MMRCEVVTHGQFLEVRQRHRTADRNWSAPAAPPGGAKPTAHEPAVIDCERADGDTARADLTAALSAVVPARQGPAARWRVRRPTGLDR